MRRAPWHSPWLRDNKPFLLILFGTVAFSLLLGLALKSDAPFTPAAITATATLAPEVLETPSEAELLAEQVGPRGSMAWVKMKRFVEARLETPASVKWPTDGLLSGYPHECFVKYEGGNTYVIVAWFDAQNLVGAMVRTYFAGRVRQSGEHDWELLGLEFD